MKIFDFNKGITWQAKALMLFILIYLTLDALESFLAIGFAIGVILFLIIFKKPLIAIMFFMVMIPFSATELVIMSIGGVPGVKIFNILSVLMIFPFLFMLKKVKLGKRDIVFILGYTIFYLVSIFRSFYYIEDIYPLMSSGDYTLLNYVQVFILKPYMFFFVGIVVNTYIDNKKKVMDIVKLLIITLYFMSIFLVMIYIFVVQDKSNFSVVRGTFAAVLSMHGNEIANFYIMIIPVVLAVSITYKNKWLFISLALPIFIVAMLYSRAAYAVVACCILLFFVISKRSYMIPLIILFMMGMVLLVPATVYERAFTGVSSDISANELSAGRTELIWRPIIHDLLDEPEWIIYGGGRYSIYNLNNRRNANMLPVGHGHNMYLDTVINIGVLGLIFIVAYAGYYLLRFYYHARKIEDKHIRDILFGIVVGMIGYLVRGMTDSYLMPDANNAIFWILIFLGLGIIEIGGGADA